MNTQTSSALKVSDLIPVRRLSFCEEVRARFNARHPELAKLSALEGKHLRLEMAAAAAHWRENRTGLETTHALVAGSLAIQMAHEASLFHDDIIDGGKVRRGSETLYCRRGSTASLIAGDQFLTSAYCEAADTDSPEFFKKFSETVAAVVSGELLQNANRGQKIGLPLYRKIISMKTGGLFSLALSLPATLDGSPEESNLADLGDRIGCLYQMLDDLFDYAPWARSGKRPFTDYQNSVWTFVAAEIQDFEFGWDLERLRTAINQSGALERALKVWEDEADLVAAKIRQNLGADSKLLSILSDWRERAWECAMAEKSRFLLEDILRQRFPADGNFDFFTKNSRSFSFAALFFPKEIRTKITHLYAFCRITDDLADGELGLAPAEKRGVLEAWRSLAERSYQGEASGFPVLDLPMRDMSLGNVPFHYASELISGALMDQTPRLYATREDLSVYTYRVASVVGQWITELAGCRDPRTLQNAARLGHAMQLTNILRDVGEDLRAGRIYLPEDLLREFDLRHHQIRDFSKGPTHPVYAAAVEAMLRETEAEYDQAFPSILDLPASFQIPVALAAEIYRGIHREIRKNGYDHFNHRARVGLFRKGILSLRALAKLVRLKINEAA